MSPSKSLSVVPTRVRPYQGRAKIARPSPAGTMQAADPVERSARSSSRWVPRLGLIRGTSSSSTTSSGRSRSAQTPVALTTLSASTSIRSPDSASTKATPARLPLLRDQLGHLGAVQHHRAEPLGLAEDREDEADVVGLAVVEEVGVVGVAGLERGDHLEQLLAVDRPVAVGRPVEVLVLLLGGAHLATAAPDPRRRHHVVHVEARARFCGRGAPRRTRGRGTASGRRGGGRAGPSAGARAAPRGPGRGRGSGGSGGRRGPSSRSGSRCRPRSRRARAAPPSSRARRRRGRPRRR